MVLPWFQALRYEQWERGCRGYKNERETLLVAMQLAPVLAQTASLKHKLRNSSHLAALGTMAELRPMTSLLARATNVRWGPTAYSQHESSRPRVSECSLNRHYTGAIEFGCLYSDHREHPLSLVCYKQSSCPHL